MVKHKVVFVGLLILLILMLALNGCQQKPVCNKPYILVGNDCCLDQNNNSICDNDETRETAKAQELESNTTNEEDIETITVKPLLSETEIKEAIELGKEKKFDTGSISYIIKSRCQNNGLYYCQYPYSTEFFMMYTPLRYLAFEVANKAKEYDELTEKEIDNLANKDELLIVIGYYGTSAYEIESANAVIKYDDQVVKAEDIGKPYAKVDNCRTTPCTWSGTQTFIFKGYSDFKNKSIKFVLIRRDGEKEFGIDMSNYK